MKRFYLVTSYLFLVTFFLSPVTSHAFSWTDFFPPLRMSNNVQLSNPKATDVSAIGAQGVSIDTYTNQLTDAIVCKSKVTVSNSWNAKQDDKYDQQGNFIERIFKYPYSAPKLKGKFDSIDLSNTYPRDINTVYTARWNLSQDPDENDENFRNLGADGYGSLTKMYSINQKLCIQSETIKETIKSFYSEDTNYADIQLGWESNGQFKEMSDSSCSPTSCRPVTVGEVAYYFYKFIPEVPILFDNCQDMNPQALDSSMDVYPSGYKTHFKKVLTFFADKNIYLTTLRDAIPLKALGPMMQKLILTNYDSVTQECADKECSNGFIPGSPNPETKRRDVGFAAVGNTTLTNLISSVTLPRTFGKEFTCDGYVVNGKVGVDKPSDVSFFAYVDGWIRQGISDEPSWSFSHSNPLRTITEKKFTEVIQETATDFANMLPAGYDQAAALHDKLANEPASSKVEDESPIDPGHQSVKVFEAMRCYLLPESMQNGQCGSLM